MIMRVLHHAVGATGAEILDKAFLAHSNGSKFKRRFY
jgi:hypothetical protein